MSLPYACSWCGASFGRRGLRAQHETVHEREERRDYESEGAAARRAGQPFDANPWPARTWPQVLWGRGWVLQDLKKEAA